tara:strand:- start:14445 stop:14963 length:519 start_codon:yes stop_codon:yes gene_type:complete
MRLIIQTYLGSKTIDTCVKRYKELGYEPEIFIGKSIIEDNIPSNKICFINMKDIFNSIDFDDDICMSQDDVYLNEKIQIENKDKINWLGYWNITKDFIMGAMLIYYPKNLLQHVRNTFNNKKPFRLDRLIHNYFDFILRHEPITKEIPHCSLIYQEYTKGKKTIRSHKYMLK